LEKAMATSKIAEEPLCVPDAKKATKSRREASIHRGVNVKIGLPNYSSIEFSCNVTTTVEFEGPEDLGKKTSALNKLLISRVRADILAAGLESPV
jgi:hypothetical protein